MIGLEKGDCLITECLEKIEIIEKGIEGIGRDDPDFFKEDEAKKFLKCFLEEIYKHITETIQELEKTQPFVASSVDYRVVERLVEKLKNLLDKYKNLFILAGVVTEEDVKQKQIHMMKFIKRYSK